MSHQQFDTVDVLRLEVERDPESWEHPNLVPNPDGAEGGWGWVTPVGNSVLIGGPDPSANGAISLKYVTGTTTAPGSNYFYSEKMPVTGGHWARAAWRPSKSPHGTGRAVFYYYNSAGAVISQVFVKNDAGWSGPLAVKSTTAFQIPASAVAMAIGFEVGGPLSGGLPTYPYTYGGTEFVLRDVRVVTAATASAANAIDIVATEPFYVDILGPTHEIEISREELNLGTLTATVLDATLDPAVATTIRKGRRVRVRALNGDTDAYEDLFVGRILDAEVAYDLLSRPVSDPKHARITLTAVDAMQSLSAAQRPEGVGRIRDLPFVLEGAGVPWVCDGNSNQVPSAELASTNDNATAVDQVALTRDTVGGYAWVDRHGVLNAWTRLADPDEELIPNPSFETNLAGWRTQWIGAAATFTRSNLAASHGSHSIQMRANANGQTTNMRIETQDATGTLASKVPVQAGTPYLAKADFYSPVTSRKAPVYVDWYDADNTYIGTSGDDWNIGTPSTVNTWMPIERAVLAPPGAVAAVVTAAVVTEGTTKMAANEQHYVDNLSFKATSPVLLLDEGAYADLDLSFDTKRAINSIDFRWLVYNTGSGETDEYHLTGYEDGASIADWGRHHKTFTIHGSGADAAASAADIFARNATPTVGATTAQLVAMTDPSDVTARAFVDLYDLVRIVNADKGVDQKARITSLRHRISHDRWIIELGFAALSAVAAPQVLPPLQNAVTAGPPHLTAVYTPATGTVSTSWVDVSSWSVLEAWGVEVAGSTLTVTRPGRYRINALLVFDAVGAVGTMRAARLVVGGSNAPYASTGSLGGSAFATVSVDQTHRLAAGATIKVQAIAGGPVNLLGGLSGLGNSRIEIQWIDD